MTDVAPTENAPAITPEAEREAIRMQLCDLLEKVNFPGAGVQKLIGCSRTTMHNWSQGKEISNAYLPAVLEVIDVINMGVALGAFPIENCSRRNVHDTFYAAIAKLKASLEARS